MYAYLTGKTVLRGSKGLIFHTKPQNLSIKLLKNCNIHDFRDSRPEIYRPKQTNGTEIFSRNLSAVQIMVALGDQME
jgi:hypothetical protein